MENFSQSYLNNFGNLKKAVIGFEFEFYSKLPLAKTMEIFNERLKPIQVHLFKQYHSDFVPDQNNFKIEPDYSGGSDMAELVTGPFEYVNAKLILAKCLKIIDEIGYTNERSAIQFSLSFFDENNPAISLNNINVLKMILNIDEDVVYQHFPERRNNIYAKSIKKVIPFKGYDYSEASAKILQSSLNLPNTKYFGVNFGLIPEGRMEFRYMGGKDYQKKLNGIIAIMDYFTTLSFNSLNITLDNKDLRVLRAYLDDNIRHYKSYDKFENFVSQHPGISLQIDQNAAYELVSAYYDQIKDILFDLFSKTQGIKNAIINLDTETKKVELVDAEFRCINQVSNIDMIRCNVKQGDFENCSLIGCDIKDSIINSSSIKNSTILDSKLLDSSVDQYSYIVNSYFVGGFMDGQMDGGIFRSGKVGKYGRVSSTTKMMTPNNFFNVNFNSTEKKGGKDKK
jgi:hypothetical protein